MYENKDWIWMMPHGDITRVKYLDEVDMPKDEFAICQSSILALMGIRDIEDLVRRSNRSNISREQLLYNLAYAQWSVKEIKEGKAWDHLNEYINRHNI